MSGEFAAIERFRHLFPLAPGGQAWIGDDAAVLEGGLLAATDSVVEGVHWDPARSPLEDVGWRAVAVSVSDIAAMGGRPRWCLVAVAGPPATDLDRLYAGITEASVRWAVPVVGGDLTTAAQMVVTVTVLGDTDDRPPVLRSGARPGDVVWVTGPCGHGAASDYLERPTARVDEGSALAVAGATAMVDVSDGLAADCRHLAEASGVGLVLEHVPVAPGATEAQALGGGDDYELVFTMPAQVVPPLGIRIGRCTADTSQRPPGNGWEHRFG